jgi:hypothetical protein
MHGADQYRLYLASAFSIDFSSLMIDTILVSFSSYCRSSVNTSDILSTGTTTTPVRSPTIQSPGRTSTPAQQSARSRLVQDLELTVRVIALIAFQDATQYGGGRRAHNLGLEDGRHVAIHEPSLSRGFIHRISDVAGARLGELDESPGASGRWRRVRSRWSGRVRGAHRRRLRARRRSKPPAAECDDAHSLLC